MVLSNGEAGAVAEDSFVPVALAAAVTTVVAEGVAVAVSVAAAMVVTRLGNWLKTWSSENCEGTNCEGTNCCELLSQPRSRCDGIKEVISVFPHIGHSLNRDCG